MSQSPTKAKPMTDDGADGRLALVAGVTQASAISSKRIRPIVPNVLRMPN